MTNRKIVKVDGEVYLEAKRIAAERGITIGDAVVEVGEARRSIISQRNEESFRVKLKAAGLTPPEKVGWLFDVLDNLPSEMVVGTMLEPYQKAKEAAEANCQLLEASLDIIEKAERGTQIAAIAEHEGEEDETAEDTSLDRPTRSGCRQEVEGVHRTAHTR